MSDTMQPAEELAILERLNLDYVKVNRPGVDAPSVMCE